MLLLCGKKKTARRSLEKLTVLKPSQNLDFQIQQSRGFYFLGAQNKRLIC